MSKTNLEKLEDVVRIQCSDGNWDHSPYMHGMANGLLLAVGIMRDGGARDPGFLNAPEAGFMNFVRNHGLFPDTLSDLRVMINRILGYQDDYVGKLKFGETHNGSNLLMAEVGKHTVDLLNRLLDHT